MRTSFLIDGFNLYHSCKDIQKHHHLHAKWLNLHSFCSSLLTSISNTATLKDIFYFSALAYHLNDLHVIIRHKSYIKCLKSTGVIDEMSHFKPKDIKCTACNVKFKKHEEKETDVAIASKMFEILERNECDIIVLVSGDTDLCPAVRTCKALFPNKDFIIALPYGRRAKELVALTPSIKLRKERYISNQFPDIVTFPDDYISIPKPPSW